MKTKWDKPLAMCDSHNRAGLLLRAVSESSEAEGRLLLAAWFNACDALAPQADGLRAQFKRVGFVTDTEDALALPATVYRAGWEDDDPRTGLSWTLDRKVAENFARGLVGLRARLIFGIDRPGVCPAIFQARCPEALGYLTGRGEVEVIPARVTHVRMISLLQTVAV